MGKMMKIALNKLIKNEKGQAMPIVMILLLIGGLIIAPLLGFMSTGVLAGQVYEEKMDGLYAADAGIENAIWKLLNGDHSYSEVMFYPWTHTSKPTPQEDLFISIGENMSNINKYNLITGRQYIIPRYGGNLGTA